MIPVRSPNRFRTSCIPVGLIPSTEPDSGKSHSVCHRSRIALVCGPYRTNRSLDPLPQTRIVSELRSMSDQSTLHSSVRLNPVSVNKETINRTSVDSAAANSLLISSTGTAYRRGLGTLGATLLRYVLQIPPTCRMLLLPGNTRAYLLGRD